MKKLFTLLSIYISPIILCSCDQTLKDSNSTKTADLINYPFLCIEIELSDKHKDSTNLSEIAHSVEYVSLSSTPECSLGRIDQVLFTNKSMFIMHNGSSQIANFKLDGVFIRNIGKIGKGPEEYVLANTISINPLKKHIYVQSNWDRKIHIYDFEGNYITSQKIKESAGEIIVWNRDSLFVQFAEPTIGNEKYVFVEKTLNGDVVQGVPNYYKWNKEISSNLIVSFFKRKEFYNFNGKLHLKGWYNDTIYTFDQKNRIVPKYFVYLKSLKLPNEYRYELKTNPTKRKGKYWLIINESNRFIFIGIAPYVEATENNNYYTYYDKLQQKLMPISRGTFYKNDIDGGPNFYPQFISDSIAYSFIEPSTTNENYILMIVQLK